MELYSQEYSRQNRNRAVLSVLHRELVSIRPLIERELIQFSLSRLGELSRLWPNSRARLVSRVLQQ